MILDPKINFILDLKKGSSAPFFYSTVINAEKGPLPNAIKS